MLQRSDALLINVELVDTRDKRQVWGKQYRRMLTDIFAVQKEIAVEISAALRLHYQAKLLQDILEVISPKSKKLISTFYSELFKRYPQVKPLFRNTDMAAQNQKLLQSLTLIVQNAENPEFLVPYLERLGKAHVTYGAKAAHYDAVGDGLLRALTVTAGRMWNEELTVAWSEAYSTAAGIMKRSTGKPGRAQTSRPGVA